jgi:DNA-directed RNA polymerase specialized sigma24 family protein
LDESSMLEIAAQVGNSVEAVKSKLARARREFRAKFEFLIKTAATPDQQLAAEKRSATKQQQ